MKCKKVGYRDELSAKIALASSQLKENTHRPSGNRRDEVAFYKCKNCHKWHLTSNGRGNYVRHD
jgi:hypothetical protein